MRYGAGSGGLADAVVRGWYVPPMPQARLVFEREKHELRRQLEEQARRQLQEQEEQLLQPLQTAQEQLTAKLSEAERSVCVQCVRRRGTA